MALASQYGRYGYRRNTALPLRVGWRVGRDRVQRIWRQEGLKAPKKHKLRAQLWLNAASCPRLRLERTNHVWSFDFVESHTHDGQSLRIMTLIDKHRGRGMSH
jgi:transposase InsO family protein